MSIADPHPRAGLSEEVRRFQSALRIMREGNIPVFAPSGILPGLRGIILDPHETSHVFTLFSSLIGPLEVRAMGHFLESERGKALLAARPDLISALSDREGLAALPEGSLGRAYLDFTARENITADGLMGASMKGSRVVHGESNSSFIAQYIRDSHDVWHVVTGYQGDVVGELALLAFSFAQLGNLGVGLLVGLSVTLGPLLPTPIDNDGRRAILEGYRLGRRARWFPTVDWLSLLPRPLDEVRRELGVDAGARYREVRVEKGESLLRAAG